MWDSTMTTCDQAGVITIADVIVYVGTQNRNLPRLIELMCGISGSMSLFFG